MDNQNISIPAVVKNIKIALAGLLCLTNLSVYAQIDSKSFGKIALQQSIIPVRPGIPGVIPFWNGHSHRFIYAPAFEYSEIENAGRYHYQIISLIDSSKYSFESNVPHAARSPVWTSVPVVFFSLTVTGISDSGESLGISGQGKYYRAAYFNGIYHQPIMSYAQSARTALDNLLNKEFVNYWLTNKKPDPGYG